MEIMPKVADNANDNVAEPVKEERKFRYLRKWSKWNKDTSYHLSHKPSGCADIPDFEIRKPFQDDDCDAPYVFPLHTTLSQQDESRLKQETTHLSFDIVLKVLASCNYDVDATIAMAQEMAAPDLMSDAVKDMFVANIPIEREARAMKNKPFKKFYLSKMLKKSVDTKTLVDFYYSEKNGIGGNWRLEHPDFPTKEELKAREEKMKSSNISIIRQTPPKKKNQKIRPKKTGHRKRIGGSKEKDDVPASPALNNNIETKSEDPSPENSKISTQMFTDWKYQLLPINEGSAIKQFRLVVPKNFPSPSNSEAKPPRKVYKKRSIEELRGGEKKDYPERVRKPRVPFE
ncbi:CUE domain-containing protein [Caenorhabditis elegans]|uniref:CUE domain-containing protein n=1 Tax=Caenorhabditis elegans TaxID=6239 RepID=O16979_CAEEL|nr:CUE domain-containing protein [Caenorhabditis elegans]CCD71815.1 CUE domain-containing protein [Caenorhabditis elegans]|eukprot:NP_503765.3 Uncharacterized protein CELE_T03D3.5 [Caenorhabditis elegans]